MDSKDLKRAEEHDKAVDDYYVNCLQRAGHIVMRFNQGSALDCESGTLVAAVFDRIAKPMVYLETDLRREEKKRDSDKTVMEKK